VHLFTQHKLNVICSPHTLCCRTIVSITCSKNLAEERGFQKRNSRYLQSLDEFPAMSEKTKLLTINIQFIPSLEDHNQMIDKVQLLHVHYLAIFI